MTITAKPWSAVFQDGELCISHRGNMLTIVEQATTAQTWAPSIIAAADKEIAELRALIAIPAAPGIQPISTAPRCGRRIDIYVKRHTSRDDMARVTDASYVTYLRRTSDSSAYTGWHAGMGDRSQNFFDDDGLVMGWSEIPKP